MKLKLQKIQLSDRERSIGILVLLLLFFAINYVFLFPSPDDVEKILEFRQKENYPFEFLTMEGSLEEMKVRGLPSTVIYDTEGKEHYRLLGAHKWDNEDVIYMLKQVP